MINYRKEVCVESFSEALLAWELRADRLEMCSNLAQDGLTPPLNMVRLVIDAVEIPVKVMIRPRKGDFVYSVEEIIAMCQSIREFRKLNVAGFVLGVLTPENKIDEDALRVFCKAAGPLPITFHKAIDKSTSILESVTTLKAFSQVKYILTSGGSNTASEGVTTLKRMQEIAEWDLEIIPAGKITIDNVESLHSELDFPYYHGRKLVGTLE